jgi:hypothetical protein
VRRNTQIAKDLKLSGQLPWRAQYYIGQKYNAAFGGAAHLKEIWRDSHSFCSELIAHIYEDMQISICGLAPEKVLPVHLEISTECAGQWMDAKSFYEAYFRGNLVPTAMDRLLDEAFSTPDLRPTYIHTVQTMMKCAASRSSAVRAINGAHRFLEGLPKVIEKMPHKEELATQLDLDNNSFKSLQSQILQSIFLFDKALKANDIAIEPIHWTEKTAGRVKKLDLVPLLATFRQLHKDNVEVAATFILEALEQLELMLLVVAEKPGQDAIVNLIVQWAGEFAKLINGFQNFENYKTDLDALDAELHRMMLSEGLHTKEMRTALRYFTQEIQWRKKLYRASETLTHLHQNPRDHEALYNLYQSLLELIPVDSSEPLSVKKRSKATNRKR